VILKIPISPFKIYKNPIELSKRKALTVKNILKKEKITMVIPDIKIA
jgi:hypothetical protein